MEIIQERLYREFNMDVITTVPNVSYKVHTSKGEVIDVHNPSGLPEPTLISSIEKPTVKRIGLAERIDLKSLLPLVILRRRGDNHFGHVGHHERHFVTHRIFQPFAVAERPAVERILRPKLNGHRYGRHKQIKKSSHNIFPTVQFSVTGSAITRLRVLRPKNNG